MKLRQILIMGNWTQDPTNNGEIAISLTIDVTKEG